MVVKGLIARITLAKVRTCNRKYCAFTPQSAFISIMKAHSPVTAATVPRDSTSVELVHYTLSKFQPHIQQSVLPHLRHCRSSNQSHFPPETPSVRSHLQPFGKSDLPTSQPSIIQKGLIARITLAKEPYIWHSISANNNFHELQLYFRRLSYHK